MIDKQRRAAARRVRVLMNEGKHRKEAFYVVIRELRQQYGVGSRASLYAWCERFGVSTR